MNHKHYPSDLTDVQWKKRPPFLPTLQQLGRPLKWGSSGLSVGMKLALCSYVFPMSVS